MNSRFLLFLFLLLVLVPLNFAAVIDINGCGETLDQNGNTYQLTEDLVATFTDLNNYYFSCLTILDNNIVLDGNGFGIYYGSDDQNYRIGVYASTVYDLTIKNLTISNFNDGIDFNDVSRSIIHDNNISGNSSDGIVISNYSDIVDVNRNIINDNYTGVRISNGSIYNFVRNNDFNNNYAFGVHVSDASSPTEITDNNILNSGSIPFYFSGQYSGVCAADVSGNTISGGDYNFFGLGNDDTTVSDFNAAFVYLCGVDNFDLNNVNITSTHPGSAALILFKVTNSEILDVNFTTPTNNGVFSSDTNNTDFIRVHVRQMNQLSQPASFGLLGHNNWVTEGIYSDNNASGMYIIGNSNFVQYTTANDNNGSGFIFEGNDNNLFAVHAISNTGSGIYFKGNNPRVTWTDINYNGFAGLRIEQVYDGYFASNEIYTNDENAILIINSRDLEIGGNSVYGDNNSTGLFIEDSNDIFAISNHIHNFYYGIQVLNDNNSNIFANVVRDSNYGVRIQNSINTDLNLTDIADIVEIAVSIVDSNFLRIVDNIINVYSSNVSDIGLELLNSHNSDINNNQLANSNINLTLADSSNNQIRNNTFFDASSDWINISSSSDNNLENNYFIASSNGRLKQTDLLSLPTNLDLNTSDLNILDNNAIINLGSHNFFRDANFLVEFTGRGILKDTNITRKGELCSNCTDLNSDSEGVYYFTTTLGNDNNIEYFSIFGTDTNDSSSVAILSPSNNSSSSSTSVTIDYNFTPLWHYIEVADFFVSDNNLVWVDNNDNVSYTFTGQSSGSKTYYVHAIDTLGNSTETVSVNVSISLSSGSSGGGSRSHSPSGGSSDNTNNNSDDTNYEVDDVFESINKSLKNGEYVEFKLSNEFHRVTVLKVNDNNVDLLIESDPINTNLIIGQTKSFDLNNDNKNDISVTLVFIDGENANIKISFEYIENNSNTNSTSNNNTQNNAVTGDNTTQEPLDFMPILVILIIILIIGAGFYYYKTKIK